MRKQAQDTRTNKGALEMQNVLQAAITFINTTGKWPVTYACNSNSTPDPNFIGYLPNGDYQSNFGANFCWSVDNGSVVRFWVALPLPGSMYKIAQQIAAQLPNAYAVTDPNTTAPKNNLCTGAESICYVRAEVAQTAASSNGGGIVATGYCKPPAVTGGSAVTVRGSAANVSCTYINPIGPGNNPETTYTITFPCPSGRGNVVIIPNYLYVGTLAEGYQYSLTLLKLLPDDNNLQCNTNSGGLTQCRVSIIANNDLTSDPSILNSNGGEAGYIGATYIGYCDAS